MKTLNLSELIIHQNEIVEALTIEFNEIKKKLIDAKRELNRLKSLRNPSVN